jgi:hypothetical protein
MSWCVVVRRAVPPAVERVVRVLGPFGSTDEAHDWMRNQGVNHLQHHYELCELESPAQPAEPAPDEELGRRA